MWHQERSKTHIGNEPRDDTDTSDTDSTTNQEWLKRHYRYYNQERSFVTVVTEYAVSRTTTINCIRSWQCIGKIGSFLAVDWSMLLAVPNGVDQDQSVYLVVSNGVNMIGWI